MSASSNKNTSISFPKSARARCNQISCTIFKAPDGWLCCVQTESTLTSPLYQRRISQLLSNESIILKITYVFEEMIWEQACPKGNFGELGMATRTESPSDIYTPRRGLSEIALSKCSGTSFTGTKKMLPHMYQVHRGFVPGQYLISPDTARGGAGRITLQHSQVQVRSLI